MNDRARSHSPLGSIARHKNASLPSADVLLNIIPTNIFSALAEGTMLQIIFFALILGFILGNLGISGVLPMLKFTGTVYLGLIVQLLVVYMVILFIFTRLNPIHFLKKMWPVMVFAFSTSSSNATIMLTMVFSTVGLPVEGIAMVMGIDRILDMGRTAVNVTGDGVVTTCIASICGMLNRDAFNDDTITTVDSDQFHNAEDAPEHDDAAAAE